MFPSRRLADHQGRVEICGEITSFLSDEMQSNPIAPPEHAIAIVMRAEYLRAFDLRGKCFWFNQAAVNWLRRARNHLKIAFYRTRHPAIDRDFRSYITTASRARNRAVCLYASMSHEDRWIRAQRRATIEHEHAHAEMGLRQVRSRGRWFNRADHVMYAVCDLPWLDVKEAVFQSLDPKAKRKFSRLRKIRHPVRITRLTPNDSIVNESLARVAGVLTAFESRSSLASGYQIEVAYYQLSRDPDALRVVADCTRNRFGSFAGLLAHVDSLLGI